MYIGLHVQYTFFFLSDFNETLFFFDGFSKNTQMSSLVKIRPVGTDLFHADSRTDRRAYDQADRHDEADRRFSQFCQNV